MVAQRGIHYYLYQPHSLWPLSALYQSVFLVLFLSFEPSISKPRPNGQDAHQGRRMRLYSELRCLLYTRGCVSLFSLHITCVPVCVCVCVPLSIFLSVSLSVRLSMCVSTSSPRCTIDFPLGGSQRQDCREPPLLAWISAPADSPLPQTATARKALMYTPVL